MEFHDVVYGRRSHREYASEGVDNATLEALIDAAIQAPNATNSQPWRFTVIRDSALLDRISQRAKAHLLETSASGLHPSHFRNQLASPDFHIFYHAPVLILISAVEKDAWSTENCALAAQNLMLTAFSLKLASCWIGFAQHWLQSEDGKKMIGLPDHHVPVAPIIVGYPRADIDPVARQPASIRWIGS